jgi:GWxTD domain-containing protein
MKRLLSAWVLVPTLILTSAAARAESLPELFQKCKEQVKGGSWKDALDTLSKLETEAAKPGNEQAHRQLEWPLAFYRGVCEANLGESDKAIADFSTFLEAQPNADIDAKVYSKKAVAAFEKARKAAASRAPSMAELYKEFEPPKDAAERDRADAYWADGPVRWILSDDEKKSWSALTDPNARVAFVEHFWEARAALAGAYGRTYQQEFARRVAFADVYLAESEEQRGSVTDRGMVFILVGPPTYAGRRPMRTGDDANDDAGMSLVGSHDAGNAVKSLKGSGHAYTSGQVAALAAPYFGQEKKGLAPSQDTVEVWHYRRELLPKGAPYQQVDFQFLTKPGYGTNVLQREAEVANTLEAAQRLAEPGK